MSPKYNYKNRQGVDSACKAILKYIQPGDVINQFGDYHWWQFWLAIGSKAIQYHQKKLFGRDAAWKDDHTMLFFDKDSTFSVEPPKATFKPLLKFCLSNISIFRFKLITLAPEDITIMKKAAEKMDGTKYDYGQLLDIAINHIMGYEHQRPLTIFDFSRKRKVCSVGIRVVYEYLYQKKYRPEQVTEKWLFDKLNPEKWKSGDIEKFRGTDVEATSPAYFANSNYFQNEFKLIARFNNGVQIFP